MKIADVLQFPEIQLENNRVRIRDGTGSGTGGLNQPTTADGSKACRLLLSRMKHLFGSLYCGQRLCRSPRKVQPAQQIAEAGQLRLAASITLAATCMQRYSFTVAKGRLLEESFDDVLVGPERRFLMRPKRRRTTFL
jgi:hypothetical protein